MNDRMSELYASACLYARDKHYEDKDVPAFVECMANKFAELIIEECTDNLRLHGYDDAAEQAERHLKLEDNK